MVQLQELLPATTQEELIELHSPRPDWTKTLTKLRHLTNVAQSESVRFANKALHGKMLLWGHRVMSKHWARRAERLRLHISFINEEFGVDYRV